MNQKIKDAALYAVAVFIPFLAVGLRVGMTMHFWINLFLSLVFFGLPAGTVHAWWVIYTSTRPAWYPYNSTAGLDPAAARVPHKGLISKLPHRPKSPTAPRVGTSRTGSLAPKPDLPVGGAGLPANPLEAQPSLSPDLIKPAGAVDPALGATGSPTSSAGSPAGAVKPAKAGLPTADPTASPKTSATPLAPKPRKSSKSLADESAPAAAQLATGAGAAAGAAAGTDDPDAITKAGILVSENGDATEAEATPTKNPVKKLGAGI